MKRAIFLRDPARATTFLIEQARADRPSDAARGRALERALLAATGAALGAQLLAAGGASGKTGLTASALVPWALTGVALGIATAGALGTAAHFLEPPSVTPPPTRASSTAHPRQPPATHHGPLPPSNAEVVPPQHAVKGAETTPVPLRASDRVEPPPAAAAPTSSSGSSAAIVDFSEAVAPPSTTLQRELSLLDLVRTNLAVNRLAAAEQALGEYERAFPSGVLHVEATAMRIELLGKLGRHSEARELGRAFLARYPESPSARRVRWLLTRNSNPEGP